MLENEREFGEYFEPTERRNGLFYLVQFEERLLKLEPYPDSLRMAKRFATDKIKLYPDKFTSAVLWRHDGNFDILLSSDSKSGYRQLDHDKILKEYGLSFDMHDIFMSFVMTAGSRRYMLTNALEYIKDDDLNELMDAFKRYRVAIAFSTELTDPITTPGYALKSDPETTIAVGNYSQMIDELLYDDWIRQIAEVYGLTNTEWLRLRVAKELPQGRRPKA